MILEGSFMDLTKREKMKILLEQLQLIDDMIANHFEQSALNKLVVHKNDKLWHFYIEVNETLPFVVYEMLQQGLRQPFIDIATTQITLNIKNKEETTTVVTEYWHKFLSHEPALIINQI